MKRVLFVCLGNICRSPTAEGVFRKLVADHGLADRIEIDSAGTGAWHVGSPPDSRAQAEARRRGMDLSGLRARQVRREDFERFDLILAMDRENLENLWAMCPPSCRDKVRMFTSFGPPGCPEEVPDPYYGGPEGFRRVFDLIEACGKGLLEHLACNGLKEE